MIQDRTSVALSEGADPKTDFIFKRVFSTEFGKPLLAALPHRLLEFDGDRAIVDLQRLTPEQRVDLAELTLSIVDVKCTDASSTRRMVEMQSLSVEGFDVGRRALSRRDEARLTTGFSERDGDGRAKIMACDDADPLDRRFDAAVTMPDPDHAPHQWAGSPVIPEEDQRSENRSRALTGARDLVPPLPRARGRSNFTVIPTHASSEFHNGFNRWDAVRVR